MMSANVAGPELGFNREPAAAVAAAIAKANEAGSRKWSVGASPGPQTIRLNQSNFGALYERLLD